MPYTDPLYGLSAMLEYLDGLRSTAGCLDNARAGLAFLKSMGFTLIHRAGPPVLRSTSPVDLKVARKALRLTNQTLAAEAGVSINAVIKAQTAGTLTRKRTIDAITAALIRLGANLPTDGHDPGPSEAA